MTFTYTSKFGTTEDCFFHWSYYRNGNIALTIKDKEGIVCICSVNGTRLNNENEIAIKNYSENEGMVKFLKSMGIIENEPFYNEHSGFVIIPYFKLTKKGIECKNDYLEHCEMV